MNPTVPAAWLLANRGRPDLVLVDVRPREAYLAGHLPGALSMNVYDYFVPDTGPEGLSDLDRAVTHAFGRAGIDDRHTVVFYEEATGMVAPRGLHFHEYAGFRRGAVLDGGLIAWRQAGGAVVPGEAGATIAVESLPAGRAVDPARLARIDRSILATGADVRALDARRQVLLDVRRRTEFTGEFAHDCCPRRGRIPGARHLYWEDLLEEGRYRAPQEIRAAAGAAGVSPDQEVLTYCHRGARAAAVFYALRLAGFPRLRVFIGSWHEWANDPHYPLERSS